MAKKLNYNLYLGENPNPKDTNNIVVQGTVENGKLTSIESAKIGTKELVESGESPRVFPNTIFDSPLTCKEPPVDVDATFGDAFSVTDNALIDTINYYSNSEYSKRDYGENGLQVTLVICDADYIVNVPKYTITVIYNQTVGTIYEIILDSPLGYFGSDTYIYYPVPNSTMITWDTEGSWLLMNNQQTS